MKDIGIDLGTANILIYKKGDGIVLNEPSVIAVDADTKNVLAVGKEASQMLGRTPGNVKAIKPLQDGVIADFEYTEILLSKLIKKIKGRALLSRPRIIICCPSNITPVEKNAIKEVAERLGAKRVYVEEEPKVAAIGSGIDISKPSGNMVIDIGGGTTDIAVLSLGSIVDSQSLKIAGTAFDNAIVEYIKEHHNLLIGETTAEDVKMELGCVFNGEKTNKKEIKGRSISEGLPSTITISEKEIEEALNPLALQIIQKTKSVLEKTVPELSSDIYDKGIVLTGGGSLLKGFAELFEEKIKVPVFVSDNPLTCVADGCGIMLNNIDLFEK